MALVYGDPEEGRRLMRQEAGNRRLFTIFSRLPYEIRSQIWVTSFEPRIIEPRTRWKQTGFFPSAKTPTGLLVCRESRKIFEPYYPKCFGSETLQNRVRVNFEIDTILISRDVQPYIYAFLGILTTYEFENIQYLAIDRKLSVDFMGREDRALLGDLKQAVRTMVNLRELVIVYQVVDMTNDFNVAVSRVGAIKLYQKFPCFSISGRHGEWWPWRLEPLPDIETETSFHEWAVANIIAVYGWRGLA
jgi:hypothetical protein